MTEKTRRVTVSYLIESLNLHGVRARLAKGNPETVISAITTDSRTAKKGELFIAVKGVNTDGHLFVKDALSKGVEVVLVEESKRYDLPAEPGATVITVSDTHKALALAASAFYGFPTEKLHLIGVTGTNGKTTTTILIESIYRHAGFEVGRIGTIGYCWKDKVISAPLTTPDPVMLQRLFADMVDDGISHVVMEVSSHALYQKRIFGCYYDVAVFTNLSHDHLDFHRTMEDYFQAKSILFLDHLSKKNGWAIINVDDPYGVRLTDMLRGNIKNIFTYGIQNDSSSISPANYRCTCDGTSIEVNTPAGKVSIKTRLLGCLNVYNILAAIGAGIACGISLKDISNGISSIEGVDGRLQKVHIDAPFHVIVDYAHTPDAMQKALSCIREWASGRIIAVFGCGGDRDRAKRPLMAQVAAEYADVVIITSDNPRTEEPQKIIEDILKGMPSDWLKVDVCSNPHETSNPSSPHSGSFLQDRRVFYVIVDRREAIKTSLQIAKPGDVIFIGGKGHETYQIIGQKKFPFDDRDVVRELFRTGSTVSEKIS